MSEVGETHTNQESTAEPMVDAASPLDHPLPFIPDQRLLVSELCEVLDAYLEPDQVKEVYEAYLFGAEAHDGQHRKSGEPYIYHPIAVAHILANMGMDHQSIVAAILHDVIEDTGIPKEKVAADFGEEVAELVDGVSKLTHLNVKDRKEAQAANFQKMILAMTRDVRVIIIKLADRLHNMRTLGAMPPDKKRRISRETLDIYAPIANRLGMNRMRLELEDLGFEAYYPVRSRILRAAVHRARGNRKQILNKIENAIGESLNQEELSARVLCREKHLFGIYRKMRQKDLPFEEVFDVYAVRLIVDKVDTCYRALGIMHNLYKPVPGKFKDYIAIPKANGYQSLHSILFGPHGVAMEVQIRTEEMDSVAENGIAAHWLYKAGDEDADNSAQVRARRWLKELLEMQQSAGNSLEFLENVKVDLFPDEVYVFTPQGTILELPKGATPVDFAYAVHSDVGHTCVAAKIDRRLAPLSSELHNGQTVEIITAPSSRPNPAWLNFVVTGKARGAIRHFLKQLRYDEAVSLGRRLLDKELADHGLSVDDITDDKIVSLLSDFHLKGVDDLLEAVGLGNRTAGLVGRAIMQLLRSADESDSEQFTHQDQPLAIRGSEGAVVSYGKCCHPLPGDKIVGYVSAGKGLVIHMMDCPNVMGQRSSQPNWIDLDWADEVQGDFSVPVRVEVSNRRGVLATIATVISEMDSNIKHVEMDERDGKTSTLDFVISVKDRVHLARIIKTLHRKGFVMKIQRTHA